MIVKFNSHEYTLDLDELDVEHARVIKRYCGLTLKGLEEQLAEGDPDAMTSLYWLMLKQNGQDHNIDKVSFKVVKFAKAIAEAQKAEKEAKEAAEAAEDDAPKDNAPARRSKKSAS